MRNNILNILGFLIISKFFLSGHLIAQSFFPIDSASSKSTQNENNIEYGFDKIVNTFSFKGNANIIMPFTYGTLSLKQIYLGRAIISGTNPFWDDELLNIGFDFPATDKLSFSFKQNVTYFSSDIKTQALSKISQAKSTGGLQYLFTDNFFVETNGGYESDKQGNFESEGSVFELRGKLKNYNLEGYFLNSDAVAEYISLNDGRKNNIFDIRCSLFRNFDEINNLKLDVRYKSFFYPVALSDVAKNSIKNRLENSVFSLFSFNFGLSEKLFGSIGLTAENKDVFHSYNKYYSDYKATAIETNRNVLSMNISAELFYRTNTFFQSIGMGFSTTNEKNNIFRKYEIEDWAFDKALKDEKKLDNYYSTTLLKARTAFLITDVDSLSAQLFFSLYRYDTPSEEINDDRDELTNLINLKYSHIFSEELTASIEAETQMIHYVYIKSARSADNNWYRTFRLSPSVRLKSKGFEMEPAFYVAVNYYAYDFEDISLHIDSYSIREIGYIDSIKLVFNEKLYLRSKIKIRYYEQGLLFWDDFSETPQNNSYEHFIQALVFYDAGYGLSIGSGGRFFELKQKNLGIYALNNSGIEHFSFAPETVIDFGISKNIKIDLRGWYEFQRTGNEAFNEIPNLLLTTKIIL